MSLEITVVLLEIYFQRIKKLFEAAYLFIFVNKLRVYSQKCYFEHR